jgi:hypothetical protein
MRRLFLATAVVLAVPLANAAPIVHPYLEPAPYATHKTCCPSRAAVLAGGFRRCTWARRGGGGLGGVLVAGGGLSELGHSGMFTGGLGPRLQTDYLPWQSGPVAAVPGPIAGSGWLAWLLLFSAALWIKLCK